MNECSLRVKQDAEFPTVGATQRREACVCPAIRQRIN